MTELWGDKHRPDKIAEVVGQPEALRRLVAWANAWKQGKPGKKAILLYGPTGSGKSAALEAIAKEFGWDIVEMNAGDRRTMSEVKRVAGVAATTGTIFGRGGLRLIVIDDADRIHGTLDRGGYQALLEIVRYTNNPLAMVANDPQEIPWELRAASLPVVFQKPNVESVAAVLQRVCRVEGISADPAVIRVIAETSGGDIRGAINDLQTTATGKKVLKTSDLVLYRRDRESTVHEFISGLLSLPDAARSRELIWSLDMPPEDALGWISENVPKMVTDALSRVRIYETISRADVFLGRSRRTQKYTFWGYASDMMTAGVSSSAGENLRPIKLESPSHIRRYARTRADRAVVSSLCRKIAAACHTSSRVARRDILPYLRSLSRSSGGSGKAIAEELELSEAEAKAIAA